MSTLSLEEQIKALEGMVTANADQFRAKNVILSTLRTLVSIRDSMDRGDATDKVANSLIEACGLRTPPPERS